MKLLSADDRKEFINPKKTSNSRRIKEALTIKDLSRSFSEGKQKQFEIMFIEIRQFRCDKKIYKLTRRRKGGLRASKEIRNL